MTRTTLGLVGACALSFAALLPTNNAAACPGKKPSLSAVSEAACPGKKPTVADRACPDDKKPSVADRACPDDKKPSIA